ncbi:MAG: NCS2 family permease, partial [Deltaproteobacteria bacterium]|nr:NCS2 family permease [Deltaproteobacteria bacterium]
MKIIKPFVSEGRVDYPREFIGGAATFMTMAYIIFVNPAILSAAGMDFKAVTAATCLASAFATVLMAFLAKYPIALAPGMGLNAFFAFNICIGMNVPWQVALGMVFIEGVVFTLLTFFRIREMIIDAVPASLKLATAAGIGLFIAFIGLKDAGIVVADKNTFVALGKLGEPAVILALCGLLITSALMALNVRGAILIGILLTGAGAVLTGMVHPGEIAAMPDMSATFLQLDIAGALKIEYLAPIFVLFFFDLFDTVGTLIGVAEQGGFI